VTGPGNLLRELAAELRREEERRATAKRDKCAAILVAARGLGVLTQKLQGSGHAR
jgi:hypothetical protein